MAPPDRGYLLPVPPCTVGNCTGNCVYPDCLFPTLPPLPSDTFTISVHHKTRLLPILLVAASCLLVLSFLLLIFYSLLRRRNSRLLRSQHQHQQHQDQDLDPHPHPGDLFLDVGDDGPHHVWLIRTVGLDESVIKSIVATVYKSGDGLIDGGDCTVCLGEFSDGEVIKLLPKCSHAFHLSCIDTWLRSHVSCPLCRAPVVARRRPD